METIDAVLAKFEEPKSKPLNYIRKSASKSSNTQELLGDVFKLMVSRFEKGNPNKNQLPKEIFIQNFESEQIWQQLELRNKILKSYVPRITKLLTNQSTVKFPYHKKSDLPEPSELEHSKDDTLTVENDETSSDESGGEEIENENKDKSENNENMNEEDEHDDNDDEESNSDQRDEASETNRDASAYTGDMFFDFNEMESFLEKAENEDPETGGDDEIDYFTDNLSSDEEDGEQPMYNDFFKDPSSKRAVKKVEENEDSDLSDEDNEDMNEPTHSKKRSKRKNENSDEANSSKKVRFMSDNDETDDSDGSEIDQKSSFEKKNSRLKEQIAKLEENALSEKPWPQRGEVDAQQRPVNSLLEEIVDVDLTTRPAPIMTEKVTLDLESIIIKRIKDKAFDDVEKKIKPVHVQHELKKELVLNQEKSKFSLAQVYEQEFLSKQEASTEQETVESKEITEQKEEILKMMKSVFKKLDTLSNFHYTPKPVTEELKIISNAPAISLEEAIPMAVADSSTLAPQEVSGSKKKTLIGKDERTKTDKRRERRKKKAFLSKKFKKSKNAVSPATKVLKSKNVSLVESSDKDKTVSTSTKFFTKLQENSEVGGLTKKPKGKPTKVKPHK